MDPGEGHLRPDPWRRNHLGPSCSHPRAHGGRTLKAPPRTLKAPPRTLKAPPQTLKAPPRTLKAPPRQRSGNTHRTGRRWCSLPAACRVFPVGTGRTPWRPRPAGRSRARTARTRPTRCRTRGVRGPQRTLVADKDGVKCSKCRRMKRRDACVCWARVAMETLPTGAASQKAWAHRTCAFDLHRGRETAMSLREKII